ncbi:uncharacterized protein LOC123301505 [Chrysoperla carnea]|uniref:uncharacterized protein LOC123301505 n=1 Tax=Chrysoperla carnea TaxID=189513 RepID=UPI001D097582|nr:uncharacterized protein LOC123301505 [Chrysoperla carnea]
MKLLSLLYFVSSVVFVNSLECTHQDESNNHTQAIFKHRENLANGYNGTLSPLDPLHVGNLTFSDNIENDVVNITIHEAIITGLSSFNSVKNCLLSNGSFVSLIGIPSLNVAGNYSTVSEILGVSRGTISATLNNIEISINGTLSRDQRNPVSNLTMSVIWDPTAMTNIEIKGKNISENYVKYLKDTRYLGKILNLTYSTYQPDVIQFLTNYFNAIENRYTPKHQ